VKILRGGGGIKKNLVQQGGALKFLRLRRGALVFPTTLTTYFRLICDTVF
jgi:hypothetical protein